MKLKFAVVGSLAAASLALSACAGSSVFGENFARDWNGVSATLTTYNQTGQQMDRVHGISFRVSRDTRFNTQNIDSDGKVTVVPGEVLLFSIGKSHISHVGSSACLVQDGVTKIADAKTFLEADNKDPSNPMLNDLREKFRNLWHGKAKTVMIRSQNGDPIVVYGGNEVEIFGTDIPKSTQFRIDKKYVWCYRVDYTIYDSDLLN
ncbi:MAG TPA: DUF5052 family protein [Candidatus Paceibacterota bacterium]|jgi:outer membrane lipoprotein-sorting protein